MTFKIDEKFNSSLEYKTWEYSMQSLVDCLNIENNHSCLSKRFNKFLNNTQILKECIAKHPEFNFKNRTDIINYFG
ncbi:MAG: hypothetical protein Q8M06_03955 [Methanobacteriaceae archaeon]|nr:hypothetical protein [Methanobacteriaceae archaeon]